MPANQLLDTRAIATESLPADWRAVLESGDVAQVLRSITEQLQQRLDQGCTIFPADPWKALRLTPLDQVKVVILGQDPYHGLNQAQGLAFSVPQGCPPPPSLRNIFKELDRTTDLVLGAPRGTDLAHWARQGVLLLNTVLTVEEGSAASHARLGWQTVTDALISAVARRPQPTAFLLWGRHAQDKLALIEGAGTTQGSTRNTHCVLMANHPSPLSALRGPTPFIGCDHFILCNQWLKENNILPIDW